MSRVFNFNAGPSTLPLPVLEQARDELVDFHGAGMSILEMSHRSHSYEEVHNGAVELIRRLLDLPEGYRVLFLGGGATLQFAMAPLNLLTGSKRCDFTLSGSWANRAAADAAKVGTVRPVFDGAPHRYTILPDPSTLDLDPAADYVHLTSNETIGGVQWPTFPDTGEVPLVCDMSSDFLSRRLPVAKFGLMYAGAQKNVGPAGVTVVIIREDLLDRCPDTLPAYLQYRTHAERNSLYNTPPVFAVYLMKLVLEHLAGAGGLAAAEWWAEQRSRLVYDAIAAHSAFYSCPVTPACRSRMNVVFRLPEEALEERFVSEAESAGLHGLKGHRSVGGCRASLYNAMPVEGAKALAGFMADFARRHG